MGQHLVPVSCTFHWSTGIPVFYPHFTEEKIEALKY